MMHVTPYMVRYFVGHHKIRCNVTGLPGITHGFDITLDLLLMVCQNDEGAHCVNRGCVALTLISKFRVIPQLERFRFFS